MNRVVLVGRITRDPELKMIPNGSVVNFTLAVNRPFLSRSGEREADFINCVVFNKQAENLSRYIRKGALLGIDGRIQTRTYVANDGTNRYITEVLCESIQFLEPKSSSDAPNYNRGVGYQTNQGRNYQSGNSFRGQNQNIYDDLQYENYQFDDEENSDKKDPFENVETQYGITDDDLPF